MPSLELSSSIADAFASNSSAQALSFSYCRVICVHSSRETDKSLRSLCIEVLSSRCGGERFDDESVSWPFPLSKALERGSGMNTGFSTPNASASYNNKSFAAFSATSAQSVADNSSLRFSFSLVNRASFAKSVSSVSWFRIDC